MTALPHDYSEPAEDAGFHFRLAVADLRRAIDDAPEERRTELFSDGAAELVLTWSGQVLKPDLVDELYAVGVATGIRAIPLQEALAAAYAGRSA